MAFQYSKKLRLPFEEVVGQVMDNLQEQGFSMMATLDVKDQIESEIGVQFRKYKIISACNPALSYKAISLESHIGTLLPCNIMVQEHENGQTEVSAINPMESLDQNMTTSSLEVLASEISTNLRTAIDKVQVKAPFRLAYN